MIRSAIARAASGRSGLLAASRAWRLALAVVCLLAAGPDGVAASAHGSGTLAIDGVNRPPAGRPYLTFTASADHDCGAGAGAECEWGLRVYETTPTYSCVSEVVVLSEPLSMSILFISPELTLRASRTYVVAREPWRWARQRVPELEPRPVRLCLYQAAGPGAQWGVFGDHRWQLLASADWAPGSAPALVSEPMPASWGAEVPDSVCAHWEFRDGAQDEYDVVRQRRRALDVDHDGLACERVPDRGVPAGRAPTLSLNAAYRLARGALRRTLGSRFTRPHALEGTCVPRSRVRYRCRPSWWHGRVRYRPVVWAWTVREPGGGARGRWSVNGA